MGSVQGRATHWYTKCRILSVTRRSFLPPAVAFATDAGLADTSLAQPPSRTKGEVSLEHCLLKRRSVRSVKKAPLPLTDLSQLLWAVQGITAEGYLRTAPSAGDLRHELARASGGI